MAAEATTTDGAGLSDNVGGTTQKLIDDVMNMNVDGLTETMTANVLPAMMYAAAGLACIFVGYLVAKYLGRVISGPIRKRVDETFGKFIGKMVFYLVMFGVTGAVLSKMGAPLGGLAAMLAAAGFAVGLAFQGTLANFASGVLMLVFRPFKVGDFIDAGGVSGTVNEIDLFTTTLDTPDNRRIIVPNSSIAGGTIENISHHAHRRIEVVVGVDYSADQDETRTALTRAAEMFAANTVQGESRGFQVVLASLGDSAVEWKVRMWVNKSDFWPMTEKLTGEVKRQLDSVDIGIPFPQMDIHVASMEGIAGSVQPQRVRPTRRAAG